MQDQDSKFVPEAEWQWFGSAAHFICGQWCRFHLATKVGDYLVSTVGEYIHPRNAGASEAAYYAWMKKHPNGEEIGANRFYETMVFKAGSTCTAKGCNCGLPTIAGMELDSMGFKEAGEATRGHLEMCRKFANLAP